jgi:hypothetical protein
MRFKEFNIRKWLYHGTSDKYLSQIKKTGLQPNKKGNLYLTSDFWTAKVEAYNTTIADYGWWMRGWDVSDYDKNIRGVGGTPIILKINPKYINDLKVDPEYSMYDDAFIVKHSISRKAIEGVTVLPRKPSQATIDFYVEG